MNALNIGGEGEIPGVLNVQPPFALLPGWRSTTPGNPGKTVAELEAEGHQFLIAPNDALPFADGSADVVYTGSVPLDTDTRLGPGVYLAEIWRILEPGGRWVHTDPHGRRVSWFKQVSLP